MINIILNKSKHPFISLIGETSWAFVVQTAQTMATYLQELSYQHHNIKRARFLLAVEMLYSPSDWLNSCVPRQLTENSNISMP